MATELKPERIVKVEYWRPEAAEPFALLLEGDRLSDDEVLEALRGHLSHEPTGNEMARVAFTNEKGERWRKWRGQGMAGSVRVVDETIYL